MEKKQKHIHKASAVPLHQITNVLHQESRSGTTWGDGNTAGHSWWHWVLKQDISGSIRPWYEQGLCAWVLDTACRFGIGPEIQVLRDQQDWGARQRNARAAEGLWAAVPFHLSSIPSSGVQGLGCSRAPWAEVDVQDFLGKKLELHQKCRCSPNSAHLLGRGGRGGDGHVLQAAFCSLCQAFSLELARVLPALAPSKCYTLCGAAKVPRREAGGSTKGMVEAGLRFPGLLCIPRIRGCTRRPSHHLANLWFIVTLSR